MEFFLDQFNYFRPNIISIHIIYIYNLDGFLFINIDNDYDSQLN